jgi:hypothetical protein
MMESRTAQAWEDQVSPLYTSPPATCMGHGDPPPGARAHGTSRCRAGFDRGPGLREMFTASPAEGRSEHPRCRKESGL